MFINEYQIYVRNICLHNNFLLLYMRLDRCYNIYKKCEKRIFNGKIYRNYKRKPTALAVG